MRGSCAGGGHEDEAHRLVYSSRREWLLMVVIVVIVCVSTWAWKSKLWALCIAGGERRWREQFGLDAGRSNHMLTTFDGKQRWRTLYIIESKTG